MMCALAPSIDGSVAVVVLVCFVLGFVAINGSGMQPTP
jgi:hypothetical protein